MKINNIKLTKDNICVSIGNVDFETLELILNDCEFAEIRLDLLDIDISQIFNRNKSLIATYRKGNEPSETRMEALILAMSTGADFIDIDISEDKAVIDVLYKKAKECGTKIILSYHDFDKVPSIDKLQEILILCEKLGADFIKIACQVNSSADLTILNHLYLDNPNVICFGMGQSGTISRVNAPILGAPFTYVYHNLGKPTADGQIEKDQLIDIYRKLGYMD